MAAMSTTRGSKIIGAGAWTLTISGLLPWFTSGAMSQGVLVGRSWVALLSGLAALLLRAPPMSAGRVDVGVVRLGLAGVGLLTGISGLVVRPAALGPSGGVVVCIVGSVLLAVGALMELRHERDQDTISADGAESAAVDSAAVDRGGATAAIDDARGSSSVAPEPRARSTPRRILRAAPYVLLLAVGVMVIWPVRPGDLAADPQPSATYDEAVERFRSATADEPGGSSSRASRS